MTEFSVQDDIDKQVNEFLTKKRMEARKRNLERKFKDGVFDK